MVQGRTLCPRRRNHPASGDYHSAGYGDWALMSIPGPALRRMPRNARQRMTNRDRWDAPPRTPSCAS